LVKHEAGNTFKKISAGATICSRPFHRIPHHRNTPSALIFINFLNGYMMMFPRHRGAPCLRCLPILRCDSMPFPAKPELTACTLCTHSNDVSASGTLSLAHPFEKVNS
jgi:hypothetical protein